MPYLIDSDWVIDFLAQESEALQLIEQLAQEGIAISIAIDEGICSHGEN